MQCIRIVRSNNTEGHCTLEAQFALLDSTNVVAAFVKRSEIGLQTLAVCLASDAKRFNRSLQMDQMFGLRFDDKYSLLDGGCIFRVICAEPCAIYCTSCTISPASHTTLPNRSPILHVDVSAAAAAAAAAKHLLYLANKDNRI